jgi:site-specific DNA-methyltransferase (adenine-specific)
MIPASDLILLGENLDLLGDFDDGMFQMIYIDPPFNTRSTQTRRTLKTVGDDGGDRTGFQGRRYRTEHIASSSYSDSFDDYVGS